jgi:hypothetical protein
MPTRHLSEEKMSLEFHTRQLTRQQVILYFLSEYGKLSESW